MKTTLLLLLAAAALVSVGSYHGRQIEDASRKSDTLEIRIAQIGKEAFSLPTASSGSVQNARALLDNLNAQSATLHREFLESAAARARSVGEVKLQEASAKRAEKTLSPPLRTLLLPAPAELSAEGASKRLTESAFLQALIAAGVEEIDYLALSDRTAQATSLVGEILPFQIRFRAKMGETTRFLTRLASGSETLPLHRIVRLEMRPLPAESASSRPGFLVDLNLETLPAPAAR